MSEIGHEPQYSRPANHVSFGFEGRARRAAPMSAARWHLVEIVRMAGFSALA